jgi:5-methyltetrahydropteroyltriglutamate--homocysteine methyltransferase
MLTLTDLPLLPTQSLGNYGLPSWIWIMRDAIAEGKVGPADIQETLRDAVNMAIADMTEAGLDIISDGDFYRADFTWNFHERIHGLEKIPFERRLGYPGPDQLEAFRAVEPLTVPNGYGFMAEIHAPCVWYVYKDEKKTPAYHYPRTGQVAPFELQQ